ncbi:hypothetical protein SDJN02_27218, partial [Cucurbita argyrosperma subsp. argyrosperma]
MTKSYSGPMPVRTCLALPLRFSFDESQPSIIGDHICSPSLQIPFLHFLSFSSERVGKEKLQTVAGKIRNPNSNSAEI